MSSVDIDACVPWSKVMVCAGMRWSDISLNTRGARWAAAAAALGMLAAIHVVSMLRAKSLTR
eukprot:468031-Hanusia_phi.AAC.1